MGCGCIFATPYEKCAFLLKDYNKLVLKRKNFVYNKEYNEKKKTDKKALDYKVKIYKKIKDINNKFLTQIETEKLKHLNDLYLVLLDEESKIKSDNISNNKDNNNINDVNVNHYENLIIKANKKDNKKCK